MSKQLDVYRDWLKIPDGHRPPDHYALLGLDRGTEDVVRINAAADARLQIVRPRCLKFPEEGTQLLNEIAQARLCLTDDEERKAYDCGLSIVVVGDLNKWSLLHANPLEFAKLAAAPPVPAAEGDSELETYRLSAPKPEPLEVVDLPTSAAKPRRWCPHCGVKLLPKATFCSSCSLSELSSLEWKDYECRQCQKRLQAGLVICRKCKHDHALLLKSLRIPPGQAKHKPYYVRDWLAREGRLTEEADGSASPTGEEPLEEFAQLTDRQKAVKRKQAAEERAAAEAANPPHWAAALWYQAVEIADDYPQVIVWAVAGGTLLGGLCLLLLLAGIETRDRNRPRRSTVRTTSQVAPARTTNWNQPAAQPAAAAEKPSTPTGMLTETTKTSPSSPEKPNCEQVFQAALQVLNDRQISIDSRLKYWQLVRDAAPDCNHPERMAALANDLRQAAANARTLELRQVLAAAQDADSYRALWNILQQGSERDYIDSDILDELKRSLDRTWYNFELKLVTTEIRVQMELDEFDAALDLLDSELPVELSAEQKSGWYQALETAFRRQLASELQTMGGRIRQFLREKKHADAVRLLAPFDPLKDRWPDPVTTNSLNGHRRTIFRTLYPTGFDALLTPADQDAADLVVDWMMQDAEWSNIGRRLRAAKSLAEAEDTPPSSPKINALKVQRLPFRDPPKDYAEEKRSYAKQLDDPKERASYYNWYRRFERRSNGHKAGYFVLIKDGRVHFINGLARAAFEVLKLDPQTDNEKPTTITYDWYGTLSEAQQAYPVPTRLPVEP
jgi:hypothetical protein